MGAKIFISLLIDFEAVLSIGVLRTPKYGNVAFAVLNSWVPVPEARQRQKASLRALIDATGAEPRPYVSNDKPVLEEASVD